MKIKNVVVIGSGTMGSGIAAHLCNADIPVTLLDLKTEISEKARERIHKSRPPLLIDKSKINNIKVGNISDDFSGVVPVVRHAIDFFDNQKITFKTIAMIYPTAPFLSPDDLKNGMSLIHKADFVASVTSFNYPIQRALALKDHHNYVVMDNKEHYHSRSQDLEAKYHDAAHFVIGKNAAWKEKIPFLSGKTRPVIIPRIRVQDIDEEEDWKEAELRFKLLQGS